jgi:hypothetical protein
LRFFARRYRFEGVHLEASGDSWDVLGTVLGANYGCLRSVDRQLLHRAAALGLNVAFRLRVRASEEIGHTAHCRCGHRGAECWQRVP